jgi:hypothetical protein
MITPPLATATTYVIGKKVTSFYPIQVLKLGAKLGDIVVTLN